MCVFYGNILCCAGIFCVSVQPFRIGAKFLKFLAKIVTIRAVDYTMRCKGWIDSIVSLLNKLRDFNAYFT